MELKFWGVRGSAPVCGKKYLKYGGQTPCASLLSSPEHKVILDAGTGIIPLGQILMNKKSQKKISLHILLTHFHIDHILGLLFFAPLYAESVELNLYSPLKPDPAQKILAQFMGGRLFPIDFKETKSKKLFKQVSSRDFHIGNIRISSIPLRHPQGSSAYKFQEKGKRVVFATDTEHPEKGWDERLAGFAEKADILVYDSMFTPEEYIQGKRGWGHSTWLQGTRIAEKAGVKKLYLSHFNPSHSDKKIDSIIRNAQKKFQPTYGAKQGLTIRL